MEDVRSAKSKTFDFTDPLVPVRVAIGLLYIPHIVFKLMGMAGAQAFFAKAGLQPPLVFVVLAIIAESICAIGLTFGIPTKWTGLMSAGVMADAAYATVAAKGSAGRLWNLGGIEYIGLWALLSVLVSFHAWRQEHSRYGRNFVQWPHAVAA